MDVEKFRKVIKQREETDDEWSYGVEQCWKQEIALITEDIPGTIEFLKNDCTAEEFSWLSEILDDIVEIAPSREFVQCYRNLMDKFPVECVKYNIKGSIEIVEKMFDEENANEEKN